MADTPMFPVYLPRAADEWMKETGNKLAGVACYNSPCRSRKFRLVAAAGERNYRIVCAKCDAIQPELTGLYLGSIGGVA